MNAVMSLAFLILASPPMASQVAMDWERVRSIAESQHEIAMLHIEKKEFSKAVEEAKKIFYLPFPKEKESLLVEEAREVSDALVHFKQHELALQILDEGLRSVQSGEHQAELYKEKAYLYKKMGRDSEAMECFRKAVELKDPGQ